jgi:hypothetical protein
VPVRPYVPPNRELPNGVVYGDERYQVIWMNWVLS